MEIKITVKYQFTPIWLAKIQRSDNAKWLWGYDQTKVMMEPSDGEIMTEWELSRLVVN